MYVFLCRVMLRSAESGLGNPWCLHAVLQCLGKAFLLFIVPTEHTFAMKGCFTSVCTCAHTHTHTHAHTHTHTHTHPAHMCALSLFASSCVGMHGCTGIDVTVSSLFLIRVCSIRLIAWVRMWARMHVCLCVFCFMFH